MSAEPEWWNWELELSPHVLDRMTDRAFSETDLRVMLADATRWRASAAPGRFVIPADLGGQRWEVVVEPDEVDQVLVVVTAYPVTGAAG
jgi:hypothetical protein